MLVSCGAMWLRAGSTYSVHSFRCTLREHVINIACSEGTAQLLSDVAAMVLVDRDSALTVTVL